MIRNDKSIGMQQNTVLQYNELAERTGLEPATPGVTGRYSNQLNYRSASSEAAHLNTSFTKLQVFARIFSSLMSAYRHRHPRDDSSRKSRR